MIENAERLTEFLFFLDKMDFCFSCGSHKEVRMSLESEIQALRTHEQYFLTTLYF